MPVCLLRLWMPGLWPSTDTWPCADSLCWVNKWMNEVSHQNGDFLGGGRSTGYGPCNSGLHFLWSRAHAC